MAMSRVYGTINKSALIHNLSIVRKKAPSSKVMAVVKSKAYGHGLLAVSKILEPNIDAFAVATVDEAVELRESGVRCPICVLSGFYNRNQVATLSALSIDVVIYCSEQLDILESELQDGHISVWIKIDTGMHRLGYTIHTSKLAIDRVKGNPNLKLIGLMSHLACADDLNSDFTQSQLTAFKQYETFRINHSIANSAGVLAWSDSHLDWVRPGLMLYGASPIIGKTAAELELKPVMNLYSTLVAIGELRKGERIGYGQTWTSTSDRRYGIVCCGYGDGFLRSASSRANVLIDGRCAKVIGRVSMDSLAIDLSRHLHAKVGTKVKLLGDGMPVEDLAIAAKTTAYEIFTTFNSRPVELSLGH